MFEPQAQGEDWLSVAYKVGAVIAGVIVFLATWYYCIAEYGFLLGVGLGWLPAYIVAMIAAVTWPLWVAALLYLFAG